MPTIKQRIAYKAVLNGTPINKAMKIAKYSDATAKTTGKLTRTKGWKELMEKHLPDSLLAKVHREGLEAGREIISKEGEVVAKIPDYDTRHRYLDTAYKLKGSYAAEKTQSVNVNIDVSPEKENTAQLFDEFIKNKGNGASAI